MNKGDYAMKKIINNTNREYIITDEFNEMIKSHNNYSNQKKAKPDIGTPLPNYLWVNIRGGGNTTNLKLLTENLHEIKIIEFRGKEKYIEFTLEYKSRDSFDSELRRLDNEIKSSAGYNRYFRGVICININEWLEHIHEDHFKRFLNYISESNHKILVILLIHTYEKNMIEIVESVLSAYMRIETIVFKFPDPNKTVDFLEKQYMKNSGFILLDSAKTLLIETIKELTASKNFNGFKKICQIAEDILYTIIEKKLCDQKHISAEMLSDYSKDSSYVKRAKYQINTKKTIGFIERGV